MTIEFQGFGPGVPSDELKPGDLVIGSRGPTKWLVMRVNYDVGAPFDLVLAQLNGEIDVGPDYPRRAGVGAFKYSRIEGRVVARPASFPLPTDDFPAGVLAVGADRQPFVRTSFDGVDYFNLMTGLVGKVEQPRVFYSDWDLVQVVGPREERLIIRMAKTS